MNATFNVFVLKNGTEEKVLENVDLIEEVAGGLRAGQHFWGGTHAQGQNGSLRQTAKKRMLFQPV